MHGEKTLRGLFFLCAGAFLLVHACTVLYVILCVCARHLHLMPPKHEDIQLKHSAHVCEIHDGEKKKKEKPITGLRLPFVNLVGVQLDQWAKAHTII